MRVSLGPATWACAVVACATVATAFAQAVVRDVPLGRYVPYGLDGTLVRVDAVTLYAHVGTNPRLREHRSIAGADGFALVHLSVRNPTARAENIPLFQATTTTDDGRTIDPAVYGPFVGASTVAAPTSATIAPHALAHVTLAVADVPDGHALATIVLNPNDATAALRVRLPRVGERSRRR